VDRKNLTPQQLSQERQEVLLTSARQAFLDHGLAGCSVDHIARLSGVSKSTIYRHFPNKEAIFEAVNLRIAEKQGQEVTAFALDIQHPAETLKAFARHIYAIDTKPEYLESFRLFIAEAGRMPELIERIRGRGIVKVLSHTRAFFQTLIDQNKIQHPNAELAASTFYVLARGKFRPLLGNNGSMGEELERMEIDIDIFLKGIGLLRQGSN
jgi:AcrR family transcriptional regulator